MFSKARTWLVEIMAPQAMALLARTGVTGVSMAAEVEVEDGASRDTALTSC